MTVRKTRHCRLDSALFVSFCTLLAMSFVNASGINSDLARAGVGLGAYQTDEGFYPLRRGVYQSTGGTTFPTLPDPVQLLSAEVTDADNAAGSHLELPAPGITGEVETSFRFAALFDSGWMRDYGPIVLSATGISSEPDGGEWQTEILSMNFTSAVSGGNGSLTYSIRESPTLPSLGSHSITPLPDGRSLINSFFDVFLELSIDDGPFMPAEGSVRLELTEIVPEPASLLLACLAGLLCLANRLCRRS